MENHIEQLLKSHEVQYSRGTITENKARPDFLFPGITQYTDKSFPASKLVMLGVKVSCKEGVNNSN